MCRAVEWLAVVFAHVGLGGRHLEEPPQQIWRCGARPRIPRDAHELLLLTRWFHKVKVMKTTYDALLESRAASQLEQGIYLSEGEDSEDGDGDGGG